MYVYSRIKQHFHENTMSEHNSWLRKYTTKIYVRQYLYGQTIQIVRPLSRIILRLCMYIAFLIPLLTLFGGFSAPAQAGVSHSSQSPFVYHATKTHVVKQQAALAQVSAVSASTATSSSVSSKTYIKTSRTQIKRRNIPQAPPVATQPPVSAATTTDPAPATTTVITPVASSSNSLEVDVALEVLRLINSERANNGLSALQHSALLSQVATAHSADMQAHDYFNHTNKAGCSSSCRVSASGYQWKSVGENIYWMTGRDFKATAAATKIVSSWMNSPGHRANILSTQFSEAGIGIATNGAKLHATANFAHPR